MKFTELSLVIILAITPCSIISLKDHMTPAHVCQDPQAKNPLDEPGPERQVHDSLSIYKC